MALDKAFIAALAKDDVFIFRYTNHKNEFICETIEDPRLCVKCAHSYSAEWSNDKRNFCSRLKGKRTISLVTGESGKIDYIPCYAERYTNDIDRCGINGKFWEQKKN